MSIFLGILLLIFLGIFSGNFLIEIFNNNLERRQITKSWSSLEFSPEFYSNELQDGIPDGWQFESWGGARGIVELFSNEHNIGNRIAKLTHTNKAGDVALTQKINVNPGDRVIVSGYAQGEGGAIQVQLDDQINNKWVSEGVGGWIAVPASVDWQHYVMTINVPENIDKLKLLLRGSNIYDDIYAGKEDINGTPGANMLLNASFEEDGYTYDPITYWLDNVEIPTSSSFGVGDTSLGISYQNILSFQNGQYASITNRGNQLNGNCAYFPDMTAWLTAWGEYFEQEGGFAAKEKLYNLAIQIAPKCPQPYAALASLYSTHNANYKAAQLYHLASKLADESNLAGKYAFEEGFIHVRYTGLYQEAELALRRAENTHGWEGSHWELGAASYFLGQALEQLNRKEEAVEAYQRVLNCVACRSHHKPAIEKLQSTDPSLDS